MMASTVSSKILKAMAKQDGFHFLETLTGFKWMGNKALELMDEGKHVLFAYEEAIGFMVTPTVLDKDGVSAGGNKHFCHNLNGRAKKVHSIITPHFLIRFETAHLATLAAYLRANNQTLAGQLDELYKQYGYHYTSNSYFLCYEPDTIVSIFQRIRTFDGVHNNVSRL